MLHSMEKNRSAQTNQELGQEHLGREIWDNTVIHGENHVEESPERSLKRRQRRFGERRSGVEEDAKRYLHPGPLLYID
jgi:hypothetical protein